MRVISQNSYALGITWFILSLFVSAENDVLSKYLGARLSIYEITMFRFLFSIITLLPVLIYYGASNLVTKQPFIHVFRGFLLFLSTISWTYGLTITQVTTATVISFTIPVFTLILGYIFLKEQVIWQRWFSTILVFLGLIITIQFHTSSFDYKILIFILAAISFAAQDVINKKIVLKESISCILFYSSIITFILVIPFTIKYWIIPTSYELFLLLLLGLNANAILFFLLKAFSKTDISALAPYRYIELIISSILAYIVFSELPTTYVISGSLLVILSTIFLWRSEN